MNIKNLLKLTGKPKLYEPGNRIMWTDDYISGELLSVHLNENLDLASRKKTTVTSTVNWILDKAKGENLEILDLGCGPGLYAEILANRGHNVTGVDFSKRSIEYAKNEAVRKKLKIEYINQNYLELNFENKFDLVILVYTDFGVLLPEDRDQLLNKIKRALKPGGIFIFDVLNDKELDKKVSPPNWELTEKGFWRDNPYLALSGSFLYKENKVILYQHIIIDESGDYGNYRFWTHFFSDDDLQEVLKGFDFKDISFDKTVLPPNDIWSGDNVTFCVVKK